MHRRICPVQHPYPLSLDASLAFLESLKKKSLQTLPDISGKCEELGRRQNLAQVRTLHRMIKTTSFTLLVSWNFMYCHCLRTYIRTLFTAQHPYRVCHPGRDMTKQLLGYSSSLSCQADGVCDDTCDSWAFFLTYFIVKLIICWVLCQIP